MEGVAGPGAPAAGGHEGAAAAGGAALEADLAAAAQQDTAAAAVSARRPVVVGVALKRDKFRKHVSERLVRMAEEAEVELRCIDTQVPIEQQGPFDAILQKIRSTEWEAELEHYAQAHPSVQVFDAPAATYPIRNRGTMLSFLEGGAWEFQEPREAAAAAAAAPPSSGTTQPQQQQQQQPPLRCRCSVPTHTTLREGAGLAAARAQLQAAGLHYPLVAKPLWADGREGSHALGVLGSEEGLRQLVEGEAGEGFAPPLLLQQYVDHGGCLFKVYVLGDFSVRVKRNSLQLSGGGCLTASMQQQQGQEQQGQGQQQASAAAQGGGAGSMPPQPAAQPQAGSQCQQRLLPDLELVHRVSAYPAAKSWGKADLAPKGHGVPSPPAWFLEALAQRIRRQLGLNLFNFDLIVPMPQRASTSIGAPANGSSSGVGGGSGAAANGGLSQAAGQQQQGQGQKEESPTAAAAAAAPAAGQDSAAAAVGAASAPLAAAAAVLEYHLIDINYFPGYEKLPNYEEYMVRFLRGVAAAAGEAAAVPADAAAAVPALPAVGGAHEQQQSGQQEQLTAQQVQ